MYVHHWQAVQMSLVMLRKSADKNKDSEIVSLAEEIITSQAEQQGRLLAWLDAHQVPAPDDTWRSMAWMSGPADSHEMPGMHGGHSHPPTPGASSAGVAGSDQAVQMPGMATVPELNRLDRAFGRAAEILFLQLMTRHHKGGVDMARALLDRSDDPTLGVIAKSVVASQDYEMNLMSRLLKARYGVRDRVG
jgi:uncharacterized protein (DUF305 family)